MISRDSLHRLVDDLPETEIVRAERLLAVLAETAESAGKPTLHSILELRGLGKELWKDIDPMEHVRTERDSWARRVPGLHPGSMEAAADFDAPLPDELWPGNE